MTKEVVTGIGEGGAGSQGSGPGSIEAILKELQGFKVAVIDGAANGTKMDVAALRLEDTILSCIAYADTWAAPVDDTANIVIQPTKAAATVTVGSETNGDVVTINGKVFTVVAAITNPQDYRQVLNGATTADTAQNLCDAINRWQGLEADPVLVATVASSVVTLTALLDGPGNAPVVTDTGSTITVSNSGTASVTAACASVVEDEALTVNGVTFVAKDTPDAANPLEVDVGASDTIMAENFAAAINAYDTTRPTLGALDVLASAATGTVTMVPRGTKKGNITTLTETGNTFTVTGSGVLANGTNTGGIKSSTSHATATLVLYWLDKR